MSLTIITGRDNELSLDLTSGGEDLTGSPAVTGALVSLTTGERLVGPFNFSQGVDQTEWAVNILASVIDDGLLQYSGGPLVDDITRRKLVELQIYIAGTYNIPIVKYCDVIRGQVA